MSTGQLKIHSENILPIIKKWLYSEKDIFVRELVSNACDAIKKLKILRDQGLADYEDEGIRIDIRIDKEKRTLTFSDTGIGMTAEEVEKYIAQLAFSGAEEFVEKYQSDKSEDQVIGHFGLGFYSAYMVSSLVSISTLSYQKDASAANWSCDGSSEYSLENGEKEERGTEITLHITDEEEEFLEEARLREILNKYCLFLEAPIYLNDERINETEPLWLKAPSECTDEDYLQFYRKLHPFKEEPLFWIHLNVDYPFNLKGILYFPRMRRDIDLNRCEIGLYCNRVFVSDNCKEILPEYLMMLHGAIDSPDIPLNVSRSYLQVDRTVRQVGQHISKKVADRLKSLHRSDKEKFLESWKNVELIVKLGAIQDEKFYEKVKEILLWKNTDSEWTTIEDYLERNKDKNSDTVFYSGDEKLQSALLETYKSKGIEVLYTNPWIDNHLIQYLEGKLSPVKFKRVDGSLDDSILDKDRENTVLDSEGKTQSAHLAELIKGHLGKEQVEVEAKSLASDQLPAFIMIDEDQRRMREYMMSSNPDMAPEMLSAFAKQTFVVNTNNSLVQSIQDLNKTDPAIAKELSEQLYDLTLLSQREMDVNALGTYVSKSTALLEQLAQKLVSKPAS
ncbi:MAG: molecular chaperone HtpG [Waddliaceae bacterium]|nr:molecular chaperone HtpG [Waddliaceae bacterium]